MTWVICTQPWVICLPVAYLVIELHCALHPTYQCLLEGVTAMSLVSRDPANPEPTGSMTDEELVIFVQGGNDDAFGFLFERYNARICRYTRRLVGNDQTGDDLAQDTFIKALKALQSCHQEIIFSGWLY